ncbi:hypothetical protein ACHAPI_011351 [Fusarium lateritium]
MNYQHQLPAVPENSVVRAWQQPAPLPQQATHPACFASRLAEELLVSRTDNMNLRHMSTQLQQDVGCWRQEYERLLAEYGVVVEHNAVLLGQISRLKEQLRAARVKRGDNKSRRNNGNASAPVSTGSSDASSASTLVASGGINEE